jgi:uncharacterized protein
MTPKPIITGGLLLILILFSACGGETLVVSHYDSGKLKAEWYVNSAGQKNGLERQYFASGELLGQVKWVEDKMDSAATYYWKNGNPRKRVQYKLGQPSGATTWFHENGQPQKEETYQNGTKDGPSREFYDSGKPKSLVTYEGNYREGVSKTWYENGNLETEILYRGGNIDGEYARFHETGKISARGLMRKGAKSGLWREYDGEGREQFECVFVDNVPNGAFTVYFPASGKVKALGECKRGLLNGQVIVFNEAGGKVKTQKWLDGKSLDGINDLSWLPLSISVKAEELVAD